MGFTGVPEGWYLIVEPGDMKITSDFDSIALVPGHYTYEFRDADANDMVGGTFDIAACPTPVPSATRTATPSKSPLPSPSAMPDTTTGGFSGGDNGLPLLLGGLALLSLGLGYLAVRRFRLGNPT